jgi:1-deoxy-D-xylulose-5-phosphate synthase
VFVLEGINGPADLKDLDRAQLDVLASEIRSFLVSSVSRTGGHLGPNLGVVELTIALHRVFDSPRDPIIFDTGHQSYVHKILTGRKDGFSGLRQEGGLSGYPNRAESVHDIVENSHASSSLSWAEGLAKAARLRGDDDTTVVAVIGDGALTGGMTWEAINNIAVQRDLRLVIVVNDNGRSYTPTVGGLASALTSLRTDPRYETTMRRIKSDLPKAPVIGKPAYDLLHAIKTGVKDITSPQGLFADLGMKYVGPVDGHDVAAVEHALTAAKHYGEPVIVHCITQKGRGYRAAEENTEDHFHAVGRIDESTGESLAGTVRPSWTDVFAEELVRIGQERTDVVAVTAAMLHPTGLAPFKATFPSRVFDVGIAEQHAVASAAGLAQGGLHPVVAVYATFLNRAFDQVLLDVALHRLGVTFVLDRAGITGPDGASHNGMWDMSVLQVVPGISIAAPRDPQTLRAALRRAVRIDDGPSVVRYPKADAGPEIAAESVRGTVDILSSSPDSTVLIVGFGPMAQTALEVGERLRQQGIAATVADPVWVAPVSADLLELAGEHELVLTIEDNSVVGGAGARLAVELARAGITTPVVPHGLAPEFLPHGNRADLLDRAHLSSQSIARAGIEALVARAPSVVPPAVVDGSVAG